MKYLQQIIYDQQLFTPNVEPIFEILDEKTIGNLEDEHEKEQAIIGRLEAIDFNKKHLKFGDDRIERENRLRYTYSFNENVIIHERSDYRMPEEYIQIDQVSGLMKHYYQDKESYKLRQLPIHHDKESSGWNIQYKSKIDKSQTKTILGFSCYKMWIEEDRKHAEWGYHIHHQYELLVTEQLNLPARLVIPLWEPITDLCALEIITKNLHHPNSYSIRRAISFKDELDGQAYKLPEHFQAIHH